MTMKKIKKKKLDMTAIINLDTLENIIQFCEGYKRYFRIAKESGKANGTMTNFEITNKFFRVIRLSIYNQTK